ncbi:metal-dependent transcriptional regulator [uncultured Tyzzerella sp.]|uniref:metal-dependent transcriptional regulator n=1 Tax=uncultured Tyzzerella sp. TaxID=2321398 RepID=UPI002943C290|nr:metal-dependent transcriptional regulator [uncultured Tyzzerella sp.]
MKIQESGENYLETILVLQKRNGIARSVDIANELNFSRASVSRAMSLLKASGYIEIGNINQIMLTEKGKEIAENIYEKHCILKEFLTTIGVDVDVAAEDACKMEHIISEQTFNCLKETLEKIKNKK